MSTRLLSVLCIVFFVSVAQAETGVTDKEITIGSCAVKSGPSGNLGWTYIGGARAYFEYVNARGGIHGRKINHIWYDDGYDPNSAIACFQQLIQDHIFAFGFGYGSPTGAKYVQMAQDNAIPFFALSAGPPFMYDPENRYVFAGRASYADETKAEVDHLWNDLGVRRIGVLYQDDAFGAAAVTGVRRALARYHSDIVSRGSYVRNTVNVADGYRNVKAANPEAVVIAALPNPASETVKLMKKDGWKPYVVVVAGRDTMMAQLAGDAAEGVVVANPAPPIDQVQLKAVALHNRILKKYSPEATPGALSMQGFADAIVLVEGLRRAGRNLTREGLIQALESLKDFDPGLGPDFRVTLGPKDHQAFHGFSFSVIRNGTPRSLPDWRTLKKNQG